MGKRAATLTRRLGRRVQARTAGAPIPATPAEKARALAEQFIAAAMPPPVSFSFPPTPAEIEANVVRQVLTDLSQALGEG